MFCPDCGLEDKQSNQFCRACGSDLRIVRGAIAQPDTITASAEGARDEIGRAIAAKIRESRSAEELAVVAEEVLPEIEKFLESPEERRLRRMRAASVVTFIGLGVAVGVAMIAYFIPMKDFEFLFLLSLGGVVLFFIGLAMFVNGLFLSVTRKDVPDKSSDADSQRRLDGMRAKTNDLVLPEATNLFSSVTENTTQHLKEKQPVPRD